jgi:hypothetical protein
MEWLSRALNVGRLLDGLVFRQSYTKVKHWSRCVQPTCDRKNQRGVFMVMIAQVWGKCFDDFDTNETTPELGLTI